MLHHKIDEDYSCVPIYDSDDFEFVKVNLPKMPTAPEILIEIGQKIFKHNYMQNNYQIPMFDCNKVMRLFEELQSLIRCDPESPSVIFITNNITSSEKLVDTKFLFEGKWNEIKSMLDFIGKCGTAVSVPTEEEEDDLYEYMFR